MDFNTAAALMGFAFVMSASPGPANFLLLSSGATFGFRRSLPLVLGISIGFLTMVFFVGLGVGQLLQENPSVSLALKFVCATYVIWLAFRIGRSGSTTVSDSPVSKPISFLQAAVFQLVNPKAWAVAIVVTVSYTQPAAPLKSLAALIAIFAAVNLPAISMWAVFGVALRRFISDERRMRAFNIAMALLLVGSIAAILFEPVS